MRVLIVGQGLAGTLLHYSLWKKGIQAVIVDQGHDRASTALAAGIINPVTGRTPKKAWMIDTLWPVAQAMYQELDQLLTAYQEEGEAPLWNEMLFYRPLKDMGACNDWDSIAGNSGMEAWIQDSTANHPFKTYFPGVEWAVVKAARVNVRWMIRAYRQWVMASSDRGEIIADQLTQEDLTLQGEQAIYQGRVYDVVVACTGAFKAFEWWSGEWIKQNKGEALFVKVPEPPMNGMLKAGILVAPLSDTIAWIGSKDSWNPDHDGPTQEGWDHLTSGWQHTFHASPEVLFHGAAMRPVTRDRRPIMGWKAGTPWAIFNGLGTKGSSLGPYWAERMAEFLLGNADIPGEVGTDRFS